MSWPTLQQSLNDALWSTNRTASQVKRQITLLRNMANSGPVERNRLIEAMRLLNNAVTTWNAASSVPGVVAYARDQFNDQTMNVAAEFTAMVGAAEGLKSWIFTAFPTSGGAILNQSMDEDGQLTSLFFTQAQLAPFVTEADILLATIG